VILRLSSKREITCARHGSRRPGTSMAARRTGSGSPTRARWHGWLCPLAAVLGVLAAIEP
jgi:hypothetical protein